MPRPEDNIPTEPQDQSATAAPSTSQLQISNMMSQWQISTCHHHRHSSQLDHHSSKTSWSYNAEVTPPPGLDQP
eukprot:5248748-Amphidinium_carterae.1